MIISQRQTQIRHRSGMNVFVMLLMLFVVSGHCSAAMLLAPQMADKVDPVAGSLSHCGSSVADLELTPVDADSKTGVDCWDDSCATSLTPLQPQSASQTKDNQVELPLWTLADYALPMTRDGPCSVQTQAVSAEFVSPPLFYTLCVLRL